MRKTSKITLVALLALALVATLCACGLLSGATALTIESMPRTSYTTEDQDYDWTGFTLRVYTNTKKDDTYKPDGNDRWYKDFSYDDLMNEDSKDFSVTPFAKGQVGTHTAQIRYLGLSVSFNYTVSESLFAGGEGTKANPYQISTAEQFRQMAENQKSRTFTYYKLINDLDMTGYSPRMKESGELNYISNCEIDGGNYWLRNLSTSLYVNFGSNVSDWKATVAGLETVIKNFNIQAAIEGPFNDGNSEFGALFQMLAGNKVVIENINVYGFVKEMSSKANLGIIANYGSAMNVQFNNLKVYADLITESQYGAPFLGGYNMPYSDKWTNPDNVNKGTATFKMTGCEYYGYAQAIRIGGFVGNKAHEAKNNYSIDESCVNRGTLVGAVAAGAKKLSASSTGYSEEVNGDWNKGTIKCLNVENESLALDCTVSGENITVSFDSSTGNKVKVVASVYLDYCNGTTVKDKADGQIYFNAKEETLTANGNVEGIVGEYKLVASITEGGVREILKTAKSGMIFKSINKQAMYIAYLLDSNDRILKVVYVVA